MFNIAKMSVLPNLVCRFSAVPVKIPASYGFLGMQTDCRKFMDGGKVPSIANTIPKEENQVGEVTLPDFKNHYKAVVIKRVAFLRQ